MKTLLFAVALTGFSLPGSAFAYSPKDAPASSLNTTTPPPTPTAVVRPTGLPLHFAKAIIEVEFSLDAAGQPQDIKVLALSDPTVKRQLLAAFRQWRFAGGASDATNGPKRFVLPIELRAEG